MNALSTNIQIFPTANRPTYDPIGRLTTEYNLTSILNRLLDVDGFVITSCNKGTPIANNSIFEFNIHGYLIHIENINDIIENDDFKNARKGDKIIAAIKIEVVKASLGSNTENEQYDHQRVDYISGNDDEDETYSGVIFALNNESLSNYDYNYSLEILEKIEDGWTIPESSKMKFKTDGEGNRSITIDDGEIG